MKLLVAFITFALTLGGLFLIETSESPKEDYTAQIIEALKEGGVGTGVSVTPSPTKGRTPVPRPTSFPQSTPGVKQTPGSIPTQTFTETPFPTPSPAGLLPSPTPSATLVPTFTPSPTPQPILEQSEKININTAGYEELQKITGVGPVIARRIIDYRNANGPFQKIEDIKNVKGIGDKTFEKMKDEITI